MAFAALMMAGCDDGGVITDIPDEESLPFVGPATKDWNMDNPNAAVWQNYTPYSDIYLTQDEIDEGPFFFLSEEEYGPDLYESNKYEKFMNIGATFGTGYMVWRFPVSEAEEDDQRVVTSFSTNHVNVQLDIKLDWNDMVEYAAWFEVFWKEGEVLADPVVFEDAEAGGFGDPSDPVKPWKLKFVSPGHDSFSVFGPSPYPKSTDDLLALVSATDSVYNTSANADSDIIVLDRGDGWITIREENVPVDSAYTLTVGVKLGGLDTSWQYGFTYYPEVSIDNLIIEPVAD